MTAFFRSVLAFAVLFVLLQTVLSLQIVRADWRSATSLPVALPKAMAAPMENSLYVMSGALGTGLRPFFELYDIAGDAWRPLTPLPVNLSYFALAAGDGRVFVSGGRDVETSKLSSNVWMYAPETAIWIELTQMPAPRSGHASIVVGNQLFVFGGTGKKGAHVQSRLQSYAMDTGNWRDWPQPVPVPVSYAALAQLGDEIVVAGGRAANGQDATTVQAFNTRSGKWRQLASLPIASSGGALGVVDGALHYAGGYNRVGQKVLDTHFRLQGKKWQKQKKLLHGRHQMAYFGTGSQLILIGGALGSGFYSLFTASDRVSIFSR